MFTYTAFDGFQLLSRGSLEKIALDVKKRLKANREARILIFSDLTGRQIDLDLSGTENDVIDRLKVYAPQRQEEQRGAGRPRLGVVPREISLLPRHWEWLANQEGGASATIRSLIDEKNMVVLQEKYRIKQAQEGTYKFLSAIAGNLPNFEEATRFLFRKDKVKFEEFITNWHEDIKKYALTLSKEVFK